MAERGHHWNESSAVDARVEDLLKQLTLEDNINLVSGKLAVDDAGHVPTLPDRFPILADGPAGLRLAKPTLPDHKATALLSVASFWLSSWVSAGALPLSESTLTG